MYVGQNEKWTMIRIEPRNPRSRGRRPGHYNMNCDGRIVTTLMGTVPSVLNLLWTRNYCCKLEIVCADGSTFVVTKGFDALRGDHWRRTFNFFLMGPYNTDTGNHYTYNHIPSQGIQNSLYFVFLQRHNAAFLPLDLLKTAPSFVLDKAPPCGIYPLTVRSQTSFYFTVLD